MAWLGFPQSREKRQTPRTAHRVVFTMGKRFGGTTVAHQGTRPRVAMDFFHQEDVKFQRWLVWVSWMMFECHDDDDDDDDDC